MFPYKERSADKNNFKHLVNGALCVLITLGLTGCANLFSPSGASQSEVTSNGRVQVETESAGVAVVYNQGAAKTTGQAEQKQEVVSADQAVPVDAKEATQTSASPLSTTESEALLAKQDKASELKRQTANQQLAVAVSMFQQQTEKAANPRREDRESNKTKPVTETTNLTGPEQINALTKSQPTAAGIQSTVTTADRQLKQPATGLANQADAKNEASKQISIALKDTAATAKKATVTQKRAVNKTTPVVKKRVKKAENGPVVTRRFGLWQLANSWDDNPNDRCQLASYTQQVDNDQYSSQVWLSLESDRLVLNASTNMNLERQGTGIRIDGGKLLPFTALVFPQQAVLVADLSEQLRNATKLDVYLAPGYPKAQLQHVEFDLDAMGSAISAFRSCNGF